MTGWQVNLWVNALLMYSFWLIYLTKVNCFSYDMEHICVNLYNMNTIKQLFNPTQTTQQKTSFLKLLLLVFASIWIFQWRRCIDPQDWFLENILVFIFIPTLLLSYRKFQFSIISYLCFFCFLFLHIYGAEYAYTQNPLGEALQNNYELTRNPYDRIVHFSFGLFLALPIKELLQYNKVKKWVEVNTTQIIFSLATIFEMIEWAVAELATKETGETYVATQGDVWDAHKDIILAVIGATITMMVSKTAYTKRN
jgi:putative membrane protein